jgi:hypothetical protein
MTEKPLGLLPPGDSRHLELWPLTTATVPQAAVPVCLGIHWYAVFDHPEEVDGAHWFPGPGRNWGRLRGQHAICVKPAGVSDLTGWWRFYDQGVEGACVGFSLSRMMSLLNRQRYDAFGLYHEAQRRDEFPGEDYSGTTLRAGCDVLRALGHRRSQAGVARPWDANQGISAYRWATSVDEVLDALSPPGSRPWAQKGAVPLLNSWGTDFPRLVWLPLGSLDRLLRENGEAVVVTDR